MILACKLEEAGDGHACCEAGVGNFLAYATPVASVEAETIVGGSVEGVGHTAGTVSGEVAASAGVELIIIAALEEVVEVVPATVEALLGGQMEPVCFHGVVAHVVDVNVLERGEFMLTLIV